VLLYLERLSVSCGGDMTLEPGTFQPTTRDPPARTAACCFCLLGGLGVSYKGQPVDRPPFCIYSLLAALLFHPRAQRRESLIGSLYPDLPERTGRKRFCDLVYLLCYLLPKLNPILGILDPRVRGDTHLH